MYKDELTLIRSLASEVMEFTQSTEMAERRRLWSDHNSLVRTRPLIYIRAYAAGEVPQINNLTCQEPYLRHMEYRFREVLYRKSLGDDFVFEPWFEVRADFEYPADYNRRWGAPISVRRTGQKGGAFIYEPPIKNEDDFTKLAMPEHIINEESTKLKYERTCEILRDIMPVAVNRTPLYINWSADISTDLAYLTGLEGMMWTMYDNPEFLHKITDFMSRGALSVQDKAEKGGDFSLLSHENQAVPYANELRHPSSDTSVKTERRGLWAFCAAQETATISPSMWEEFIFEKQLPIIEKYGLVSYGCCEDMTNKIDILKKRLKNLRRIAVTPWANLEEFAKKIGADYIMSWRPSPADMVSHTFDPDFVKKTVRNAFTVAKEHANHIDVTLKDVETVARDMSRVPAFVRCVREVIEEFSW